MAEAGAWYAGQGHAALAGTRLSMLIDADPLGDLVRALWPAIAAGELPAVVTVLAGQGMVALPSFVLVQGRPDGLLLLARGSVTAAVYRGSELLETVRAGDVTTWREVAFAGADRAVLRTASAVDGATLLPLLGGVVEAACLDWNLAAPDTPVAASEVPSVALGALGVASTGIPGAAQTARGAGVGWPLAHGVPSAVADDAPGAAADGGGGSSPGAGLAGGVWPVEAVPGGAVPNAGAVAGVAAAGGTQGDSAAIGAIGGLGVPGEVAHGVPGAGGVAAVTREWKEPVGVKPLAPGTMLDRLSFLDSGREAEQAAVQQTHYGDTVSARPRNGVAAVRCPKLHLNPPATPVCRECLLPLDPGQEPFFVAQPIVGQLRRVNSTESWLLGKRVTLLGRSPGGAAGVPGDDFQLVWLSEVSEAISELHAEVRLDGWRVEVIDRSDRGDTLITNPGDSPVRLEPGIPMRLMLGGQLRLGGEVSLVFGL